jgi:hypothetical protein
LTSTSRARLWKIVLATVALVTVALVASSSHSSLAQAPTATPSETSSRATTTDLARSPSHAAPRALVLVDAPGADAFFPAFGHEVVATALLERGFSVVPPQVAASALRADGRDPQVCLASAQCRREVAGALGAVTLVVLRLRPDPNDARRASSGLELSHAPFESLEAIGDAEGDALALGDAWRMLVARVDRAQAPCRVVVRSELAVEAMLDGHALPSSVAPGAHAVELRASGRAPWRGRLVCADGEAIEVKVR